MAARSHRRGDLARRGSPGDVVLFPLYAGGSEVHPSVQKADVLRFDKGSMWTTFNFVANYAMLKYSYMITDIRTEQRRFESRAFGLQQGVEAKALALREKGDVRGARRVLTQYSRRTHPGSLAAWWKLQESLYIKYNDGYLNTKAGIAQAIFYPANGSRPSATGARPDIVREKPAAK